MFKRIGRRFHSAKYVFSVQLHRVNPWFMHDRPAKLVWNRGSKKHKRGETQTKTPTHVDGTHVNCATLNVDESFELGVTLYAQSHKTRKTGPYGKKDLRVMIVEVDDDGSIYSILGALTINLNEYAGLMDRKIQVPVEADREITDAVGQPYFEVTIRSWYKQGHGTSASSGISSTGWEDVEGSASDVEEHEDTVGVAGDAHLDPVKPIDVIDPHKTVGTESVPEDIQADGTSGHKQVDVQGAAVAVQQTRQAVAETVSTQSAQQTVRREEAQPSVAVGGVRSISQDREAEEQPIAIAEQQLLDSNQPLDERNLLSVGLRYKRLSTINSETGEEVMEEILAEQTEDELNKFLEQEIKDEELGLEAVPVAVAAEPSTKSTPKETTEATEPELNSVPESEEKPQEHQPVATPSADIEFGELQSEVSSMSAMAKEEEPKPAASPVTDTKPSTQKVSDIVSAEHRTPSGIPHRPAPTHRRLPPRRGFFSCLPGSGLVCCQPVLPRES